ncbi:MAG TPA: GatB/YqeY domain-containing protein [Patescibacteria group bacterium]|nr:GatB/YqeY domain-containing protein [Patescibacteria group bacterium]
MLKDQIEENYLMAMKEKDAPRVSTLRMLKSGLKNREIESGQDLTDEEIIQVIQSQIKSRRDSIELYKKGGRGELAEKEETEANILMEYLPEQMSREEIRAKLQEVIASSEAKGLQDMGKVMGLTASELKGRAEMGEVAKIAKELLQ